MPTLQSQKMLKKDQPDFFQNLAGLDQVSYERGRERKGRHRRCWVASLCDALPSRNVKMSRFSIKVSKRRNVKTIFNQTRRFMASRESVRHWITCPERQRMENKLNNNPNSKFINSLKQLL